MCHKGPSTTFSNDSQFSIMKDDFRLFTIGLATKYAIEEDYTQN